MFWMFPHVRAGKMAAWKVTRAFIQSYAWKKLKTWKQSRGSEGKTGPSRRGFASRFLFLKSSFNVLNLCVQIGRLVSPKLPSGVLKELSSAWLSLRVWCLAAGGAARRPPRSLAHTAAVHNEKRSIYMRRLAVWREWELRFPRQSALLTVEPHLMLTHQRR